MNLKALKDFLQSKHPHDVRRNAVVEHSLQRVEEGLQALAGIGHHFHLAEGHKPVVAGWPRKLFHLQAAPNGRLFMDEEQLEEAGGLAGGWRANALEAQLWDGSETQFAGRGGVPRKGLPAALREDLDAAARWLAEQTAEIERRKAEFKEARDAEQKSETA